MGDRQCPLFSGLGPTAPALCGTWSSPRGSGVVGQPLGGRCACSCDTERRALGRDPAGRGADLAEVLQAEGAALARAVLCQPGHGASPDTFHVQCALGRAARVPRVPPRCGERLHLLQELVGLLSLTVPWARG